MSFSSHTKQNIPTIIKYDKFQYSSINMKILFLSSSILSLSLSFYFLQRTWKLLQSFMFTCEYPLRKQIVIIIRRELEDKLKRTKREKRRTKKCEIDSLRRENKRDNILTIWQWTDRQKRENERKECYIHLSVER